MQQIYLQSYFHSGYARLMKYISNIAHLSEKDRAVILERLKIIEFFEEFGESATKRAFSKSRSTVYLWKSEVARSGGYLSSLRPLSKAPQTRSKRRVRPEHIAFIEGYRKLHPGVDKVTLKPLVDALCLSSGLAMISESSVGRIIEELKEKGKLPDYYIRTTINGLTGKLKVKRLGKSPSKQRIGDYKPKEPGDLIQIDAIAILILDLKRYILTAIDLKTRFAFAYSYKTLSSATARDFMMKLEKILPFKIKHIQTDNGSEFAKYFDQYLTDQNIVHFWNYPRSPKSNAYIENFNGLIQRQYVGWHLEELIDSNKFNLGLMDYLSWYNTEKPHRRIGKIPPLLYYVNNFLNVTKKSNMLWTSAGA